MLKKVGIAIGDPAGIGPEISLKAAMHPEVRKIAQPILFGDPDVIKHQARSCGIQFRLNLIENASFASLDASRDCINLIPRRQFEPGEFEIGKVLPSHGRSAIDSAQAAIRSAMDGQIDAVVAAPQTEIAIKAAGIDFDGYPSFVARCTNTPVDDAFLMICFDNIRIAHATLHVSVRRALDLITVPRIEKLIRTTHATLRKIGIENPKLAISGLNPHASEDGLFGDDEHNVIIPAVNQLKKEGVDVEGPFGCDTMFHRTGYDAYLVMLHDQGHLAAKLMARNRTAGMTIGTPIIFSSVAHGSALDIAGQGIASPAAMIEAVRRVTGTI